MKSTFFATAALAAGAAASSVGSAIVINKCSYDVYLANTPSANGGYSEIDRTLSPNDQYTQQWTSLTNGNGWSLKLSPSSSDWQDILQYEYTYQNDGTIWYDLSEVNGNPWDGNWEITSSTSSCAPKQQAYRYATDDAYGMQACPADATITVTLCSGDASNDVAASSMSSSVASASSSAVAAGTILGAATTAVAPTSAFSTASSVSVASTFWIQVPGTTSAAASSSTPSSKAAASTISSQAAVSTVSSESAASTTSSKAAGSTFWIQVPGTTSAAASSTTSTKAAASTVFIQAPTTTLATSVITSAASAVEVTETVVQYTTTTRWTHTWGGHNGRRDAHEHHAARHPHHRE